MSESFDIKASTGSYSVEIETGALPRYIRGVKDSVVIADSFFREYDTLVHDRTIFLTAAETLKSLDFTPSLIENLRQSGANRGTHLVAVGGGVLQDLTAFVASIYMRGLPWTYIPTTVLAMVDSCIGGKSSINVGPYKNLVGTFHPPTAVLIDPTVIQTLPADQQISGLIEAAKICFCRGSESFHGYLECNPQSGMQPEALSRLIIRSLRAKKWFIEIDEFDKKERLRLNFGHTFGHAIEGASHYTIAHGLAVGLGILCALAFERQRRDVYQGVSDVGILEQHLATMLRSIPELPAHLKSVDLDEILKRFDSDKKHKQNRYVLILIDRTGKVTLREEARSAEIRDRIRRSVSSVIEGFI